MACILRASLSLSARATPRASSDPDEPIALRLHTAKHDGRKIEFGVRGKFQIRQRDLSSRGTDGLPARPAGELHWPVPTKGPTDPFFFKGGANAAPPPNMGVDVAPQLIV